MPKVVQDRTMNVSMESLRRAILDFGKYPEFLSEVVSAKPQSSSDGFQKVDFEIEVIKRFRYTLEFDFSDQENIRWRLLDSNFFTANEGSWKLRAVSEKQTQVQYELNVGVKFLIPGFIAKKLTEVNLPRLLDSFEARAKEI